MLKRELNTISADSPLRVKLKRLVRLGVYLALVATVLIGLLSEPVEPWLEPYSSNNVGVCSAFAVFLGLFAWDRFLLIRNNQYPKSRALIQVCFALGFMSLLVSHQPPPAKLADPPIDSDQAFLLLLQYQDPLVRAAACHLNSRSDLIIGMKTRLQHQDPDAMVRAACQQLP